MRLQFTGSITIKDLNAVFQTCYPYLKLCFLITPDSTSSVSSDEYADEDLMLIEVAGVMKEGELNVIDSITAKDLEGEVMNRFLLKIKVFRRQDHSWVPAEIYDDLNLAKLNKMGAVYYHRVPEYFIM